MKIFAGSKAAAGHLRKPCLTLGVFDGVHRGHRHIFQKCLRQARRLKQPAAVYTFDPHPVSVLTPTARPPLITTAAQKEALIHQCGFQAMIVERFNKRFSQLTPETFFKKILVDRLQAAAIYVGYDFTFGVHRSGTTEQLKRLGEEQNVEVHVVEAFLLDECLVSSSEIRKKIQKGEIEPANQLLGRPYALEGKIVQGEGVGTEIGIPTLNLKSDNELFPPPGVYVTHALLKGKRYRSVTNIGTRPTFQGKKMTVESHLLRFRQQVTPQKMQLEFLDRLRDETRFADAGALVHQIHQDIKQAELFFRKGVE